MKFHIKIVNKKNFPIFGIISLLGFLILICGPIISEKLNLSNNFQLIIVFTCLFLFIISLVWVFNIFFEIVASSKTLIGILGAVVAVFIYIARVNAVNEINDIFGIDASAMPATVTAVTTIEFVKLTSPILLIIIIFLVLTIFWLRKYFFENENYGILFYLIIIGGIFAAAYMYAFIYFQTTENKLKSNIYYISQKTDFVGKFKCEIIDDIDNKLDYNDNNYNALFIGPEQNKVMLSPKKLNFKKTNENFLSPKKILDIQKEILLPKEFFIFKCK